MSKTSRTVIITGASSGIGFALAKTYLERGFNVVGNGRTQDRLDVAARALGNVDRFVTVAGDVAQPDTAERLFETATAKFGKVDVLVNNAGIFIAKPFRSYTTSDLDALIETNLKGFFYLTQAAVGHMLEQGGGHIVNVTAVVGMQPNEKVTAVLPTLVKGGLNQATKSLALELAKSNIQVNAVAPGVIDTPLQKPERHAFLSTLNPMARLGDVQDVVDAVLYLTSSNFVTGVILPVDGGTSAGR